MLSVPEGEDRRFECSIQCGAPSPCGWLALQGPGMEAECLSLVAHVGTGSLLWPMVACERQCLLNDVNVVLQEERSPGLGGPFSVCNSFYVIEFDLQIRPRIA